MLTFLITFALTQVVAIIRGRQAVRAGNPRLLRNATLVAMPTLGAVAALRWLGRPTS